MAKISIKPDKLLNTKFYLIFITYVLFLLILGTIIQFTVPLAGKIGYAALGAVLWTIIVVLCILLIIFGVPIARLWVNNLEYIFDEERIVIHKGIITKIEQNIPYGAVTDFQLHRSLYDRVLDIGSIRIQTAGQSVTATGYEAVLAGLSEWIYFHEELKKRVKMHQQNGQKSDSSQPLLETDKLSAILSELEQIKSIIKERF